MLERYFGLIEGGFVAALALAFYLWQMRTLKRDKAALEARKRAEAERATDPSA